MKWEINHLIARLRKSHLARQKAPKLPTKSAANSQECSERVKGQNQLMLLNQKVCSFMDCSCCEMSASLLKSCLHALCLQFDCELYVGLAPL